MTRTKCRVFLLKTSKENILLGYEKMNFLA